MGRGANGRYTKSEGPLPQQATLQAAGALRYTARKAPEPPSEDEPVARKEPKVSKWVTTVESWTPPFELVVCCTLMIFCVQMVALFNIAEEPPPPPPPPPEVKRWWFF